LPFSEGTMGQCGQWEHRGTGQSVGFKKGAGTGFVKVEKKKKNINPGWTRPREHTKIYELGVKEKS